MMAYSASIPSPTRRDRWISGGWECDPLLLQRNRFPGCRERRGRAEALVLESAGTGPAAGDRSLSEGDNGAAPTSAPAQHLLSTCSAPAQHARGSSLRLHHQMPIRGSMIIPVILAFSLAVVVAENPFIEHGVVPDVIDEPPKDEIQIVYSPTVKVSFGNELTPTQVQHQPSVSWPSEEGALYTVCVVDPDAPSRESHSVREFLHYLVSNIPGNDIAKGDTLFEYVGSGPPKGTGLHRYVWLVYKQPGHIDFNQHTVTNRSRENRPKFSIRKFASEKNLGSPIAGNFLQAQWDEYVPILHKQLSLEQIPHH